MDQKKEAYSTVGAGIPKTEIAKHFGMSSPIL